MSVAKKHKFVTDTYMGANRSGGNITKRSPRPVSDRQLREDKPKLHQRIVRRSDGSTHKQGVMRGSKYGYRAGQARIGKKTVEYYSDRRGSQ